MKAREHSAVKTLGFQMSFNYFNRFTQEIADDKPYNSCFR